MSADLVAFLRARLDEDEKVARAAGSAPWVSMESAPWVQVDPQAIRDEKWRFGDQGHIATADHSAHADHIARHDPARVLRQVEAGRAIIRELCYATRVKVPTDRRGVYERVEEWRPLDSWEAEATIRALAAIYRDHEDYREEWAL